MKNKVGWIIGASLVVVFGLFFLIATTVLAPEPRFVHELENFLTDNSFKKTPRSVSVTADNGRAAVDTYYKLEVASESDVWDVEMEFYTACSQLDSSSDITAAVSSFPREVESEIYEAPSGFRQIAEVEWTGPAYDNTVWPRTITVRVRRYVVEK